MGVLSRVGSALGLTKTEGEYRPGPYYLPYSGGWLPDGAAWNFWQQGYNASAASPSAMVEACVGAYAQTVAMCPGDHWRRKSNGGRERVTNSALARLLRTPNDYQSISDLLLNLTRSLYCEGNVYCLALRNDRFEIDELHMMNPRSSAARLAQDGTIFYSLAGNPIIDRRIDGPLVVPARDVLHIRLHTREDNPLLGLSPIEATAIDVAASGAISEQQLAFYRNQARPSAILSTDEKLTIDQARELRTLWNEQAKGLRSGGVPILTGGLKAQTLGSTAKDAELADFLKLSEQHIALAFRVPLQILGIGGTAYASTELLMQSWIASGLGFALNHIEEAFGQLFALKGQPDEYVEFSTSALLRSSFKERLEAWATGTRAGLVAPNEGRQDLELPAVEFGDDPRMQQQDVPLSYGAELQPPQAAPSVPAQPADNAPAKDIADGQRVIASAVRQFHSACNVAD